MTSAAARIANARRARRVRRTRKQFRENLAEQSQSSTYGSLFPTLGMYPGGISPNGRLFPAAELLPSVGDTRETTVSFDDERQLVHTSIGWENHLNMEGPPDYGALMYQIYEARKESDNIVDFGCKTYTIICNTLLVTIIVGVLLACPIAMVSVGVKYLDDCPVEPRLPIYLLVGGCCGMIKLLSTLWRNIQTRRYQDVESVFDDNDVEAAFANTTYRTMDTLLVLFLIGWQAAGTYWTAKIWTPNFEQILHDPNNWCDETVYMFSIYQQCFTYSAMLLWVLFLFLLMCCHNWCYTL